MKNSLQNLKNKTSTIDFKQDKNSWRYEAKVNIDQTMNLVTHKIPQDKIPLKERKPMFVELDMQLEYLKHRRINLSLESIPTIRNADDAWFA